VLIVFAPSGAADTTVVCPPTDPQPAIDDVYAPPPDALIVCVQGRPMLGALVSHWYVVARKGSPGSPTDKQLLDQALKFLVSSFWTEGEATERHLHVSDTTVTRTFNRQRRASFPRLADFHRFLRETGETRSDLKWRVRLDLLSARIQRDVTRGHKSQRAKAHAFDVFVTHFQPKWKARTWCRDDYKLADYCR
jgi:hypothetical protein